jgi:hypothetical protein
LGLLVSGVAAGIVPDAIREEVEQEGEARFAGTKFERLVAEKIFAAR